MSLIPLSFARPGRASASRLALTFQRTITTRHTPCLAFAFPSSSLGARHHVLPPPSSPLNIFARGRNKQSTTRIFHTSSLLFNRPFDGSQFFESPLIPRSSIWQDSRREEAREEGKRTSRTGRIVLTSVFTVVLPLCIFGYENYCMLSNTELDRRWVEITSVSGHEDAISKGE
ncbi:hypothetical protein BT69DRAFT_719355 [Atractiella rhizophila]|nr:hypothetical protein BT69DRAFT_719355 [Atractiella rhizophila]